MKLDPEEQIIAAALDQAELDDANERGVAARIEFRPEGHAKVTFTISREFVETARALDWTTGIRRRGDRNSDPPVRRPDGTITTLHARNDAHQVFGASRLCRDGAVHQSLGVDPVITPAYHRVRNHRCHPVRSQPKSKLRLSHSSRFLGDGVSASRVLSARSPLLRNFTGGDASPFVSESGKSPSHGGNTGSNPVGDANIINNLK